MSIHPLIERLEMAKRESGAVIIDPLLAASMRKHQERLEMSKLEHFVYLITDGKSVKIGVSVHPEKRLLELQHAYPCTLSLFHAFKTKDRTTAFTLEWYLHALFSNAKLRGEWYDKKGIDGRWDEVKAAVEDALQDQTKLEERLERYI